MQCIANTLNGSYLIRNGKWIPVPEGAKLSDYPEPIETKQAVVPVATKRHQVPSSKPGKFYTVTQTKNHYSCDCQGYMYRAKCRHIEEAKKVI